MSGVLARILYALLLAVILGVAAWISFSRFVLGKAEETPDLTGKSVDEATALAAERGLRLVVDPTKAAFHGEIPAHRVHGQSPSPGMAVKAGQELRVFLSLGPEIIQTPDLTGETPRTAALALTRAGLAEGVVSEARLAAAPAGVVAQGVVPGASAEPDTPVDLLVNRGAADVLYVMPDLIGRDFERVRLAFEARGFRLGGVRAQSYEGAAAGTILRQFPLAGSPVGLKDTLSFVVASPEPSPG